MTDSLQDAALDHIARAEAGVADIPELAGVQADTGINSIAVIGAGTMGGGIAMNFLNIGLPVVILETAREALDRGLAAIRANYQRSVSRGKLSQDQLEARLALLRGTLDYADLAGADLVVEAVFEDMTVKKAVFGRLAQLVRPGAILATNTSFLDIAEIAAVTGEPSRVLGMHFFSPANVMPLLEVVRTPHTAAPVLRAVLDLGVRIGKIPVLVGNCHGFVGNRVVVRRKEQGQALILEGAMPWQVDRVLTEFGFPMGPFAMSDFAGLDIGWNPATSAGATIVERLCEQGRRGRKTGAGYYDYDSAGAATPSPLVAELIRGFVAEHRLPTREIGDGEILERCLYPMINEACRVLEEGIALRAADVDVILVNGYSFPRRLGGLTWHADSLGLDRVLAVMRKLHHQLGDTMKPAALLERLVAEGGRLSDVGATTANNDGETP